MEEGPPWYKVLQKLNREQGVISKVFTYLLFIKKMYMATKIIHGDSGWITEIKSKYKTQ